MINIAILKPTDFLWHCLKLEMLLILLLWMQIISSSECTCRYCTKNWKTIEGLVSNFVLCLQSSQTFGFNWRVIEPLSKIVYDWVWPSADELARLQVRRLELTSLFKLDHIQCPSISISLSILLLIISLFHSLSHSFSFWPLKQADSS